MLQSIFDECEPFSSVQSLDDVSGALDAFVPRLGLGSYCLINAKSVRLDQRCLMSRPMGFVRDYAASPAFAQDALVLKSRRSLQTFSFTIDLWSDLADKGSDCAQALYNNGVHYGFSVPMHGPHGFRGHLAFGSTDAGALNPHVHLRVAAVGFAAYDAVQTITHQRRESIVPLSPRERDALCLAAEGYTAWDIGEKLTLSMRTVESYLHSASKKLGATSKTQAVANAIRCGFIR